VCIVWSVGKPSLANAGYYQSEVVPGLEDYYAHDGEAPGRWIGRADLVGAVAATWRRRGIELATLSHAAGISSTEDPDLDEQLPFDEP